MMGILVDIAAEIGKSAIEHHLDGVMTKGDVFEFDVDIPIEELGETIDKAVASMRGFKFTGIQDGLLTFHKRLGAYYPSNYWLQIVQDEEGTLHCSMIGIMEHYQIGHKSHTKKICMQFRDALIEASTNH